MAQEPVNVVVNVADGSLEVSGPADFVESMVEKLVPMLQSQPPKQAEKEQAPTVPAPKAPRNKAGTASKSNIVASTSFDILGKTGGVPLQSFLKEKNPPRSADKMVVFFTYYITKKAGLPCAEAGHLMYCFEQLGIKKPGNIRATMNNAKARAKMAVPGSEPNSLLCNIAGENWVEHDLPGSAAT